MRRRRQRNPLLMRIIVISVLVHIIALPILAHFGAFKKIQEHYVELTSVKLPPPPAPPEKKEAVKKPEKPKQAKVAQKAKQGPKSQAHTRQVARANVNSPHIATASGGGTGGFTADQGNGKVGEVPQSTNSGGASQPKSTDTTPTKPVEPTNQETTKPQEIARADKIVNTTPITKPEPMPAAKQPVFAEAAPALPLDQEPQPVIPDDLRSDALDKTCVVSCTVSPDGKATDVKIAQSSGNDELDRLALDAARRWKFRPGTRDGEPVESTVKLHIEFQVS